MSGIVRGWADSMDDLREILYTKQMHDEDIPVAVVPLDDATLKTLAGEIWRHLDVFGVRLSDVDKGVRAALGLDTNTQLSQS